VFRDAGAVIDEPTTLAAYRWLPTLVLLVPFVCLLVRSAVLNITLAFATAGAALGFLIGAMPDGTTWRTVWRSGERAAR
jgi:hypothetical protein